jgi:hypothetical protein
MKSSGKGKGLTVKINLFSLESFLGDFDSRKASLWIRGTATRVDNNVSEVKVFNGSGDLLSILGKWNSAKFREHKRAKAARKRRAS